jgi:outer membrane protein assembly factor BamB
MNRSKVKSLINSFNPFNIFSVPNWALAATLLSSFTPRASLATDWPQWRGPNRDGISEEKGLLKEWPKDGPKLVWQIKDIGAGFSTPAIVGDRIYVMANEGNNNEFVEALSVSDGKKIWSTTIGKVGNPGQQPAYPAARSTPTVDGDTIYALGSDGDLVCVGAAGGKLRWKKNLRTDFGGVPGRWAYSESPLVDGDTLVSTPGGSTAVVALNKKSGDVIWKATVPGDEPAAYASAMVIKSGGVRQYVQMLEKGLVGLDAKTGKVLWRANKTVSKFGATIPTPVVYDSRVYSAGSGSGGALVQLKAGDGKVEAEQVYFSPKLPTAIGGAVKVGDLLFGTGTGLVCSDFATGEIKWEDRALGAASICFADGNLYLHGENGEVALVAAVADGYHEKGRFKPSDQPNRGSAKAWAYPVVANGKLYIRDTGTLWCYDVKAN